MKLCIITTLFSVWTTFIFGQDRDLDSLGFPIKQANVISQSTDKVDSIQSSFYHKSDSLKLAYKGKFSKLDSAQSTLTNTLDSLISLQPSSKNIFSGNKIDSLQSGIKSKIASLTSRQLPNVRITHSLDSINDLRDSTLANLNQKIQSLKDKSIGKLNELNLPPQLNDKASQVTSDIEGFKIPASDLNITSLNLGNNDAMGKFGNLSAQSPIQNIGNVDGLENLTGGGISDVTDKVGSYSKDVQQISKGDFRKVKELPKTAEAKAEELSGLNEVKDQTQALDEYKDMAGKMQSPDSLKELAIQEFKQVAVDHFEGKEQQLKAAMETVSKYKKKYSSLNSLADIKRRPPNEMKGKPFIERVVPGIALQIQKKAEDLMVDFNTYAGYRFTGRLMAGAGWNQRVVYATDKHFFNSDTKVFGPRAFGEFKLQKGFSPRIELEAMNTSIPPFLLTPADPMKREWVWGIFVGMKREYKIFKNIKGTAMVMGRLFNRDHKSPYADVLNVRFGFEFPMKKKIKDKDKLL